MIDIHTHHLAEKDGITRVFNHTLPRDATRPTPTGLASVGLHPWFVSAQDWQHQFEQVRMLARLPNVVMIGECGFDTLVIDRLPMATQLAIVEAHLELATEVNKPVIFHCVRAFPTLIDTIKKTQPPVGLVVHGFRAKPEIAAQLIELGCYLSFGAAILQPNTNAAKALQKTPLEKICLETDDANTPIERIFAAASEQLHLDLATLTERVNLNFKALSKYE